MFYRVNFLTWQDGHYDDEEPYYNGSMLDVQTLDEAFAEMQQATCDKVHVDVIWQPWPY